MVVLFCNFAAVILKRSDLIDFYCPSGHFIGNKWCIDQAGQGVMQGVTFCVRTLHPANHFKSLHKLFPCTIAIIFLSHFTVCSFYYCSLSPVHFIILVLSLCHFALIIMEPVLVKVILRCNGKHVLSGLLLFFQFSLLQADQDRWPGSAGLAQILFVVAIEKQKIYIEWAKIFLLNISQASVCYGNPTFLKS